MPKTKGVQSATEKWQRRSAVAMPDYVSGIDNPKTNWDAAAKAGEANYKTAVVAAANAGNFGKGISRVGNSKWAEGAKKKGANRFAEGVQLSGPVYQERIQQVLTTIEGVTLPPRGPKGSPQNLNRVSPIGVALRKAFGKV